LGKRKEREWWERSRNLVLVKEVQLLDLKRE